MKWYVLENKLTDLYYTIQSKTPFTILYLYSVVIIHFSNPYN